MKRSTIAALLIACSFSAANAEKVNAKILAVRDGDSLKVLMPDGKIERVRLNAIDAPELKQPFGRESRDLLASAIDGKNVTMFTLDHRDKYRRLIATIFCNGRDENLEQLRRGAAWLFTKYARLARDRAGYPAAELAARSQQRGLWALDESQPPWEFRKQRQARQ